MKLFIAGSVAAKMDKKYCQGLTELGTYIAKKKHSIICVGATTGAIGSVYNEVIKNDGQVDLIVPKCFEHEALGMTSNSVTALDSLFLLQQVALHNSDATIVVPGGNGTLAELYMITDSIKSGYDKDIVIIYNCNGYYNKVKEFNDFMLKVGTIEPYQHRFFNFCDTIPEVIEKIEEWDKVVTERKRNLVKELHEKNKNASKRLKELNKVK